MRKATGLLGLVFTIFFASSFTTAMQRVFMRAWRRPPGAKVGAYTRGPAWLVVVLVSMAFLGALRGLLGNGPGVVLFAILSLATTFVLWWFTAWFLLLGEVRWRVLIPSGIVTSVALAVFALSATVWMPNVVTRNEAQFGFFGVALALVTWFSGAAIAVLIGACAGAVFAEDPGSLGTFIRGGRPNVLEPGARPSLPPPARELSLRDAFQPADEG